MDTPISPKTKTVEPVATIARNNSTASLLTPSSTPTTKQDPTTPTVSTIPVSPINSYYYTSHLTKSQFNSILVNCTINLIKILYSESKINETNLSIFIVEILKRSKTSIQTLQLACFYLTKLINKKEKITITDPKKLFLGLVILASKFNQDYNYSFKSWLKICGLESSSTKVIKELEFKCLQMLQFELSLNGDKYENWCNVLMIFGYDFIKCHLIDSNNSNIMWETKQETIEVKLTKWTKFFADFNEDNLNILQIKFSQYFINQLNKKIFIVKDEEPKLLKRARVDDVPCPKKQRVV
ncbi:uncharacterized protein SPAPADRAFT_142523 [Spathaspora passalidarum NRRL Y-27907]|uniref:Cyclin N-terminal domain-containing protein n=1 Tax=Spathaspora passalidarum (strain NRRL Y-27907 / 11-Y1) TaxID=619300 RepID=G3AST0_SPAPN|nr:uncharacterized protein SPAPADRAFT_142523 [Spathaspora passalidarum NRRL Y-27907]EGW31145.1 hypothetical protein SPAPADRAFT_142523 [Spathaspora passalidarum NRRL Y-27907]